MSIEYMSAVWKDEYYTKADKAKLLVALAIADTANAEGFAFPSVDFIAKKARTSVRGVQELCRELEQDGKIEVNLGKGRNGTNLYRLIGVSLVHPHVRDNRVNGVKQERGEPSSPRNGAAEEAPVKAPLGCTRTIINGHERQEPPPPSPAASPLVDKAEAERNKRLPTTEASIRIANLFRRKLTTAWSATEIKSYRNLGNVDLEELSIVERYYRESRVNCLRRDLGTFLNNFTGELDRARMWLEDGAKPSLNGSGSKSHDLHSEKSKYGF